MTDTPANDPTPRALAADLLGAAVVEYCMQAQANRDGPLMTTAEVLEVVVRQLDDYGVPMEAIRGALLLAFDASHDKAMTFIDIGKATEMLKQISIARKDAEAKRALIIKPDGSAA